MAYIYEANIDSTNYLIEPKLHAIATVSQDTDYYKATINDFELIDGVQISLKIPSADRQKIKINDGNAISIYYSGSATLEAERIYSFVYDATNTRWELVGNIDYAAPSHSHTVADLPVGTGASQVAAGNHVHSYAGSDESGGAANTVKVSILDNFTNKKTHFPWFADTTTGNLAAKAYAGFYLYENVTNGTLTGLDLGIGKSASPYVKGGITIHNGEGYYGYITPPTLSANVNYTLPNQSGTLALKSDIPTNLNQLTNGPGYVTSSGVTSITIKTTSPITGGSDTATTSTGTYTIAHASGDGNKHVPATGTGNNGKFLKAGSTAGDLSWSNIDIINAVAATEDLARPIWFSYQNNGNITNGKLSFNNNFKYNPATETMTIGAGTLTATDYSGKSVSASALANICDGTAATRPTTANLPHLSNGGVQHFKATDKMTANKPMADGSILHFHWDNDNAWDSQLYIPDHHTDSLQWRGSTAAGTWGTSWKTILDSGNTASGTDNAKTLGWNTTYTIAKINGTNIQFTTMAKPSYSFSDLTSHPTTLANYGITDAKIDNGVITLGSNTITPIKEIASLTGSKITADDLRTNLGLSNAMHFIGIVASDSTNTPSDGQNETPTISGLDSYTPAAGDVVIDKNSAYEYVYTSANKWELLGSDSSYSLSTHTHDLSIVEDTGNNNVTLGYGKKYKLTAGGSTYIFTMPASDNTNTATAADDILHGSHSGTEIKYAPYTSQQSKLSFDTSTTAPTDTTRINLNGYLYTTNLAVIGDTTIGTTSSGALGIKQTDGLGLGLSLYGGPKAKGALEYGIMFAKTATFGTVGSVTSDWATYFTMNRNDARGWIFKSNGGAANKNNNVASIAGNGDIYTIGTITIKDTTAGSLTVDGNNAVTASAGSLETYGGIATRGASFFYKTVSIAGRAADNPLIVRGISGCASSGLRSSTLGEDQALYLNYNGGPIHLGVTETTANSLNQVSVAYGSDSSSTSTGAFIVAGGVGIAKKLYVGSDTNITGTTVIQRNTAHSTTIGSSQLVIRNHSTESGNYVALELQRGTYANTTYTSWQFAVEDSGNLHIKNNYKTDFSGIDTKYSSDIIIFERHTGNATLTGKITATQFNNYKLVTTTSNLNANDIRTSTGIWITKGSVTGATAPPITNNGMVISMGSAVGTPAQLYFPDSNQKYIYKRWYSSSAWSEWTKISAGYADTAGSLAVSTIAIQTGSTKKASITLETLMTWLITTKKYIPSGVQCHLYIPTTWEYANNDILKLTCEETNYELQLAGCIIEFYGTATAYNTGVFRLRIHSSPTVSFTSTNGYTKFPSSAIAEYTCNGSSFTPTWRMYYAEPASTTPTLSWGDTATIGKVNGKEFKVTAMAKPSYSYSDISSRPTSIKLTGAVTGSVTLANGENSIATTVNHTHNYAGSSSAGGAANSVANNLVIKLKSGSTEGTDLYTYNGSGAKTLDIKQGSNITLTAAAGSLTIAGTANNAVTQTAIDTNGEYSILLKKNANKTDETTGTNYVKTKSVTVNPSTAIVSAIQYYATGSTGANSSTPGFKCTVNANAWSYMALESGTTAWHIAVNNKASDDNTHVGALQFRPNGLNNTGPSIMTTGEINRWVNTTSNVPLIAMRANNKDAVLWEIGHAAHPYDAFSNHSYKMIYKGTGDGVNNTLQLVADYTSDTIAMQINLEGRTTFQERIGLHTGTSSVTEKVTLEWNSTDQSLDFIFA